MKHILIVEDTADLAQALQRNLEDEGYRADVAGRAAEALAVLAATEPDLVVLDLGLPDQDGLQVLRRLRDAGKTCPVLILTAREVEADVVRGFQLGADDYVTKPFRLKELLARVQALLRRASAARPAPAPSPSAAAEGPAELGDGELRQRYGLTERQVAVARLLGEGYGNEQIARMLSISPFTARNHTEQVFRKLGVNTRARIGVVLRGRA